MLNPFFGYDTEKKYYKVKVFSRPCNEKKIFDLKTKNISIFSNNLFFKVSKEEEIYFLVSFELCFCCSQQT